jgi:hypothetical protein
MSFNVINDKITKDAAIFGYWSSIIYIILGFLFVVLVALSVTITPPTLWWGKGGYPASQYLYLSSLGVAFLMAPLLIVLFSSIYFISPISKKYQSLLALIFTSIFVPLVCINYYIQFTAVRENILSGNISDVAMFIHQNTNSIVFAFDVLGYLFLGIASFLIAPIFNSSKSEVYIKVLFNLYGLISVTGVIGHIIGNQFILSIYGALMSLVLFILGFLLRSYFKNKLS